MKFLRFLAIIICLTCVRVTPDIMNDFGSALSSLKPVGNPKKLILDTIVDLKNPYKPYDLEYIVSIDAYSEQVNSHSVSISIKEGTLINVGADIIVDAANAQLSPGATVSAYLYTQAHNFTGITKEEWAEVLVEWEQEHKRKFSEGDALFNKHIKAKIKSDNGGHVALIHAVGPAGVNDKASQEIKNALASAYRSSLKVADDKGFKKIVFPAISTGVFGGNPVTCGDIEVNAILDYLANNETQIEEIMLLVWSGYQTDKEKQVFFNSYNEPIKKYFKIK